MKKTISLCICLLCLIILGPIKARSQTFTYYSATSNCWTPVDSFNVGIGGFSSGMTLLTYYGDGTSNITSSTTSHFLYGHYYGATGTYSVKIVLLSSGGVHLDSVTFSTTYTLCQDMTAKIYNDVNGDCVFDGGDAIFSFNPGTVEVDSAGLPVDTITTSWLINYTALGPVGTVYAFKAITNPYGFKPTCPTSGIVYDTVSYAPDWGYRGIGFTCDPTVPVDNAIQGYFSAGLTGACSHMLITSSSCTAVPVTVTINFSPKYSSPFITGGSSYTVSGNTVTINIPAVSEAAPVWLTGYWAPVGTLTIGDTVNTTFTLSPTSDAFPANNVIVTVDTIRSSYDPNYKSVMPEGNIVAGTKLDYLISFENTGNDTAHNIHVMDTLSDNLEIQTIKQTVSSAKVTMILLNSGGHNIVKFDFPNINLFDSSHHNQCTGSVGFTINSKSGLATGTKIDNRAGIYFDINDVVMTNNVENIIGLPLNAGTMAKTTQIAIYPNPVNDELTIKAENGAYYTMTISNTIGQVIITQSLNAPQTKVNVKALPTGIYYITLKGESGVKVMKFEKL